MPDDPPRGILISAGEASGDAHGAALARALAARRPGTPLFGVAGQAMREAGVEPVARVEDIAVMGFVEVLRHLLRIWRAFRAILRAARERRPELAVLIDAPDFHLRLARRLSRRGVPVVYYIGPQLWAWRPGRVKKILRWVRRMLVIFPFEEAFYRGHGMQNVEFVGHPLLDRPAPPDREVVRAQLGPALGSTLVALLPGSRRSEASRHLPILLEAAERIAVQRPGVSFVLPVAPTLDPEDIEQRCAGTDIDLRIVQEPASNVLAVCNAAAVVSGTATVEAALAGAPMVILYRTSWLSYLIARSLVKVEHIGMANLILGRRAAPELIQGEATPQQVADEVLKLLETGEAAEAQRAAWSELRERLGGEGEAASRAAQAALAVLAE